MSSCPCFDAADVDVASASGALNQVQYGLFRVTETFDKTERVLFGFVKLRSENVPAMQRAQIATHTGFITSVFQVRLGSNARAGGCLDA